MSTGFKLFRTIVARYDGRCARCGGEVKAGDTVRFGYGRVYHPSASCPGKAGGGGAAASEEPRDADGFRAVQFDDAITDLNRNAVMKRIKRALERRSGREWSVTGGRGTSYGWITIDAPPKRRTWAYTEQQDPETGRWTEHVFDMRQAGGYAGPQDREMLARLLGLDADQISYQGHSVPSGFDFYREYIDRAEGRAPRVYGERHWD